ncbi:hypothetical protein LS684_10475 [Cytobacillus spongiae]|jgi:uncharacterized membrane protein|uniref:hypothetical protein n=1 Tax=Cytobacillus spongiae TaxID=2901381 RepID=UPI001F3FCBEC|nr:hypothetical protein [Cytobacillus spongiae]UII54132.1 hypothetical protein LS684_10475 [Cytobacillus spongiae]
MSETKLFNLIGIGMFSGIAMMTFLHLERFDKQLEAMIFFGIMAIIYFVMVFIRKRAIGLFVPIMTVLAVLAISFIFLQGILFGGHH